MCRYRVSSWGTEQARRANKDPRDTQSSGSELRNRVPTPAQPQIPHMILAVALPCSVSASSSGGWRRWTRSVILRACCCLYTWHKFCSTQFLPKYPPTPLHECQHHQPMGTLSGPHLPIVWSTPWHTWSWTWQLVGWEGPPWAHDPGNLKHL